MFGGVGAATAYLAEHEPAMVAVPSTAQAFYEMLPIQFMYVSVMSPQYSVYSV